MIIFCAFQGSLSIGSLQRWEKSGTGRGAFVVLRFYCRALLLATKEVPPHDVRKNTLNGFKMMNAGGGRKHVSQPEIHDCMAFHQLISPATAVVCGDKNEDVLTSSLVQMF